ncbi:transporter [Polaribacter reichenbachii]|uniref:Transporter n=1 Tax=Polaribacter reichenbachii TaxID=996801 RepID=A0A1B8TWJ8_9FLAO|nr:TolC family protein [Polaribacter reichenbachii]APZ48033.1 transporter [Polaribacter reichenbachii]AUC20508.1 transporter [Polaribacter reichenbachii]OBY64017.1 transporter [Polaribacter reichenbachii]
MKIIKNTILLVVFLSTLQVFSQEILTKKEALAITLENNFGVKIANNNLEVAKNNTSIYNTGFLPTAAVSSGANYSKNNQTITSQAGESTTVNGAVTKSYNASLSLNYTIFDGLGRKYNYQQLKETYNLTEYQARETIENTYLQLFTAYFQIARLSENKENLSEALAISKKRLQRAQYQYDYGQTTKLEMLNAEVDVNNDSITLITAKQQLNNAKRGLNIILGVEKAVDYTVETDVNFANMMNFDELQAKTLTNNSLLKQNEQNIAISEFNIKINKANYMPSLDFSTSYGWNKSENPATSFLAGSTSTGLNAGLSLSWSLFDGGTTKTNVANAKIALENQQILLEQQKVTIENNLKNTWENYNNQLFIIGAQEKNVATTQNNFERTEERYKLGQVTSIEFRQAQINLINAKTALNNAKFDAKLIELELLQLSGDILNVDF